MSKFFKNKCRFTLALGALFLAVTLFVGSVVFVQGDIALPVKEKKTEEPAEPAILSEGLDHLVEFADTAVPDEPEFVTFNVPGEMHGTMLVPGVDFLKTGDTTEATIKAEIDEALLGAKELSLNTVIVETTYEDLVLYQTLNAPELSSGYDIFGYIIERARAEGFYTYAIFSAEPYNQRQISSLLSVGAGTVNRLAENLGEFVDKYDLDGVLIDGYQTDGSGESYASYLNMGGGMGFQNFLRQSPATIVKTASKTVRSAAPGTQVGLLADAVWENSDQHEEGSDTQAAYTSLSGGNADTKGFVEQGLVDFVAVKAYSSTDNQSEPFGEVVRWWADVALKNDVQMYVVHAADKIGSSETGWASQDQLIKQIAEAGGVMGFRGSIFNSLEPVSTGSGNLAANLTKLYNNEVEPEQVLTQLEMTKPAQQTYTTSERVVTFTGASDPAEPVTIDGDVIPTDSTGYFTLQKELKAGLNTFTIEHKDKSLSYSITRTVEVLREAGPGGSITVEGGMTVTVTAVAYEEAQVYATVGGTTVSMSVDTSVEDEQDRDSSFRTFTGEYKAPASGESVQNIGSIVVHASYGGESDSITCGSVTVNKRAKLEDGVAVRVVAAQAMTYPADTANNIPGAGNYPLPQGAMDYAVGDEITYQKDDKTYKYYVLASGLRVESGDIAAISDDYPGSNSITGLSVEADNSYTYVTLKTAQKVSYTTSYSTGGISFQFHYTDTVTSDLALSKNPLFSGASWSGSTLTLSFLQQGGFMGYKGYYDESGNLVLRFLNPPSSIAGARIAIDPGHGGRDQGAAGFLADYPESVINKSIAGYLAGELEARGATVYLMNNDGIEGPERRAAAESWGATLFVSVHSNASSNSNAAGTEVYYFHPFSARLAANAASSVSSALNTQNRGAKASYYHVTLSSQFPSVLVECGFLTNRGEYEKLITSRYQQSIAAGIADGLSATIKGSYSSSATGVESTGSTVSAGASGESETSAAGGGASQTWDGEPDEIWLSGGMDLAVGESRAVEVQFYPDGTGTALTWKSSDTAVATVSDTGKVTGVKAGTATITASGAGLKETVTVTVTGEGTSSSAAGGADSGVSLQSVDDAYFDYSEMSVNPGSSVRLEIVSADGETVRGGDFKWKSDNTSVAKVDSKGYVTGVKTGEATIIATGGGYELECYVNVTRSTLPVTGLSISESAVNVVRNQTKQLTLKVTPQNATSPKVTWYSSNSDVASVDNNGLVRGKKPGTATISVKTKDGKYTDSCTVTVTTKEMTVDYIWLEDRMEYRVGEEDQLIPEISPEEAVDKSVRWQSSNTAVVTVDQKGNIRTLKRGTATITCTSAADGKVKATCTVTVVE